MILELTDLSTEERNKIADLEFTPDDALKYLTNELTLSEFVNELKKLYPYDDIKEKLVSFFRMYDTECNVQKNNRKINEWLSGKSAPFAREDYFKICFALGFNLNSADRLLMMNSENKVHYRNPRELVYAFCLKKSLTYGKALELVSRMGSFNETDHYERNVSTNIVRSDFEYILTEEQLLSYIDDKRSYFSALHNTAYKRFNDMFSLLQNPSCDEGFVSAIDDKYSIERAVNDYLRFMMPNTYKSSDSTQIQKIFKKYWPSPSSVKKISAGIEDVPRKVLLLLYVALDGVVSNDYDELDEDYLSPADRFEEHYWRINLMLDECGMCLLDPRNPFDWVILYAVRTGGEEFMSDRMEVITRLLFCGETN